MKTNHALILFFSGMALCTAGAMFKIMHVSGANILLAVSLTMQIVGAIFIGVNLLRSAKKS